MRTKVTGFVTVRAISGTSVVFLAFSMKHEDAKQLMGFAIQRTDLTESETVWLKGNKTFASIRPSMGIEDADSRQHPIQGFQWADYAAKPGYRYQYRVIPMYGSPGALTERQETIVKIGTEPLHGDTHEVYFNRGAIASQAFARRFPGLTLEQAGAPAYAWLARDLLPGLLDFIARAEDETWSLHVAIYEMGWRAVLDALKAAHQRGAKVKIVYHAKADDTGKTNEDEIDLARIRGLCSPRKNTKLMHNKFLVLSRNGVPLSVWVGSTNWSRNALHGQLNVGHAIHDSKLGEAFVKYWDALESDPDLDTLKDWVEANNPLPPQTEGDPLTAVFSPHRGLAVWQWWIEMAKTHGKPLFITFPFGIVKDLRPVFDQNDGVLRFALLDKYVNGGDATSRAIAINEIKRTRRHPNIGMALGERIFVDWIDGWMKEPSTIGVNVNWVHTKFMMIDPLGTEPITLTGSANWSQSSVNVNDEHLVVIRGDKRVADIYFGEFMRLFAHHRFRESIARHIEMSGSAAFVTWKPQDLSEDWQEWVPKHFESDSEHDIKRRYFADE